MFIGEGYVLFASIKNYIESHDHVKNYSPEDKWPSFDDVCYYCYDDGSYKIELEINTGTNEDPLMQEGSYHIGTGFVGLIEYHWRHFHVFNELYFRNVG